MNSPSIKRRLLLASSLLVLGFTAVAAWSLSAAFEEQAASALRERAQAHIYTLLASAQEDAQGRLRMPQVLADPLFNQPDSGTYALIEGEHGDYHWRSGSLLGRQLPAPGPLASGTTRHSRIGHLLVVDQAITWDDYEGQPVPYRLRVALDTSALEAQQRDFQHTLWLWLGALGGLLLGVQLVAVRWGLKPLGDIARDIRRIEQGERDALSQDLPVETRPLVDAINTLLEQSHRRQARVRHSLADLAHSLKTPLSILRGAAHEIRDTEQAALIGEQVDRIDEVIDYQRQKAAVSGATALLPPVAVRPVAQRLGQSLHKLNSDGSVDFQLCLPEDFSLRVEPGDLMELLGNLLENAFRHAHSTVRIEAIEHDRRTLIIEDDGQGIPGELSESLLQRGVRADQVHPGEGIGLAMVSEILTQYSASLRIQTAKSGGARFVLEFPD